MTNSARFAVICAGVAFGFTAIAADHTANKWQSDGTEGLSGNYSTVGHWTRGHVPESGEFADFRKSSSFSVTMPSGTYASPAGFRAGLGADGTTFRMDFSNTTWTDPGYLNADVVYGAWLDVNSTARSFLLDCGTGYDGAAASKIEGCVIDIARVAAREGSIASSGGSVNFYDPEGTAHDGALLKLFGDKMQSVDVSFDGTDTRLPKLSFGGNVTNGTLTLRSSRHEVFESTTFGGAAGCTNELYVASGAVLTNHSAVTFSGSAMNKIRVGGTWAPQSTVDVSASSVNAIIDVVDGGVLALTTGDKFNFRSKGSLALSVSSGGTFSTVPTALWLNDSSYKGTASLTIAGGTADLKNVYCYSGNSSVSVSDGRLGATCIFLGFANGANTSFSMTGGEVVLSDRLFVGYQNTASGSVALDGGVLEVKSVKKAKDASETGVSAAFSANGGTIRVRKNPYNPFLSGMDSATLGERGLTIDAPYDATVSQAFTDAAGAEGRLVKKGAGTVTLSAAESAPSIVVAAEGPLVFADGACMPQSIVVTNGATLTVPNGVSIPSLTVDVGTLTLGADCAISVGSVSLSGVSVALSGSSASGDEFDLITTTAEPAAASIAAWKGTRIESGAGAGLSYRFSVVPDGGTWKFRLSVAAAETVALENLDADVKTNSTDRAYGSADTLSASAAAGGTLAITGANCFGTFEKNGAGTVQLLNGGNMFTGGVTLNEGLLYVSPLAALGLDGSSAGLTIKGGTLEINDETASPAVGDFPVSAEAGSNKAYVIKTDTDVSLPLPSAVSGDLIKRGEGALIYRASGTGLALTKDNGVQPDGKTVTPTTEIEFDADGTPPTDGYAGLNVAEGLLVVKGEGKDVTSVKLDDLAYIGLPVRGITAQPGLLFEDCTVKIKAATGQSIEMGDNAKPESSGVTAPTFALTNVVFESLPIFRVGSGATTPITPVIACRNSTFPAKYAALNVCTATGSEATYTFTDGSIFSTDDFRVNGPVKMTFDDSRLAGIADPLVAPHLYNKISSLDIAFCNGGEFFGAVVTRTYVQATATFRFDGGKWMPGTGVALVTNDWLTVVSEGEGLVFEPGEGDAWRVELGAIDCQAPVTVSGAGTVSFGGGCANGLVLAGSGTIADSSLTNATIRASATAQPEDVLNLSNVGFEGVTVVDLGRTAEDPLPQPISKIRIANFTGSAPAVGGWKLKGTGLPNVRGDFSISEGGVWVLPKSTGFIVIVE